MSSYVNLELYMGKWFRVAYRKVTRMTLFRHIYWYWSILRLRGCTLPEYLADIEESVQNKVSRIIYPKIDSKKRTLLHGGVTSPVDRRVSTISEVISWIYLPK